MRPLAPCVARPTRSVVKRYLSPILDSPKCSCKQRSRSESDRRVSLKNLRRYSFLAESVKLLAQLCLSFSKYFHLSHISLITTISRDDLFSIYTFQYIYIYLSIIGLFVCNCGTPVFRKTCPFRFQNRINSRIYRLVFTGQVFLRSGRYTALSYAFSTKTRRNLPRETFTVNRSDSLL